MWRSLFLGTSLIVSTLSLPLNATANPDVSRICTRTPGTRVTIRKGAGTNHAPGLVMVGSGGKKVDDFFRRNNYTVADGEQISVFSSAPGTDGQTWKKVGTNQWVAWVRGDFVCSATAAATPTLTPKDQAALKALGIAIAVPANVPSGYTVSQVKLEPCAAGSSRSPKGVCRFGPQYGIFYRNAAKDSCFAIQSVGGGLGGPAWEYSLPIRSSLLKNTAVLFGKVPATASKTPSAAQLNLPQPNLRTEWASTDDQGPFYSVVGADYVRREFLNERPGKPASQCRNTITPNEAIKIMQSLTWLK